MFKKNQIIDIKTEKLAFGGLGVATHEGLKIFVAGTVPGDEAKIRISKKKKNYAEGRIVELLKPSTKRIQAKCKHFGVCGGCTWQFLSYEDQLFYKEQIVKESLEHLGGFKDVSVNKIIGCANPWNYRNKMEFSFSYNEEKEVSLGLHPKGYHYDVFELTECHLPSPVYAQIVSTVRTWARENKVPVYESKTEQGLLTNLVIRHNQAGDHLINIITRKGALPNTHELKEALKDFNIVAAFHTQVNALTGKSTTRITGKLWGEEHLQETLNLPEPWGKLQFKIYPDAFFQPNPDQAKILYQLALEAANIQPTDTVLDLYCGTGTLGLFASRKAKRVIGIDNVPDAIKSAEANAIDNQISNAEFFVGDAAEKLKELNLQAEIALVDPPRAGLMPQAVELIGKLPLERLVYVSCNPTTQARDLKELAKYGFVIKSVQPVDMFPHTYHIENVVVFEKF